MSPRTLLTAIIAAAAPLPLASTAQAAGPAPVFFVNTVASSPTSSPTTSFTEGDGVSGTSSSSFNDTYTVTVGNGGTGQTTGTVTVVLSFQGTGVSNKTATTPSGTGWTCSIVSSNAQCTRSDPLPATQSYPPITETVQVSATAGVGTATGSAPMHVNASTTVSGGGAATSILSTTTPVIGLPDLTSTYTVQGALRQGDTADVYKAVVINAGGGATNGSPGTPIVATFTIPTAETVQSITGGGWTCNLAAISVPYTLPANSCYRTDVWGYAAELPAITVVVSMATNAPATLTPTASVLVSGGGEIVAASSTNASFGTVQQSADVIIGGVHVGSFNQGDPGDQYFLFVHNSIGPNSTAGGPTVGPVVVTDVAPAGETITSLSGSGWTCSLAPQQILGSGNPNVVLPGDSCQRTDPLAVNGNYPTITVTVAVANGAQSPLTNTATVSGGGMTAASMANGGQSSSDPTVITPQADMTVTALTLGQFMEGDGVGANDTYTITATNVGFATTNGTVTVQDTVPQDLTPQSATGAGWTCGISQNIVTCTRSDTLAAGAAYPAITVPVTIAPNAGSLVQSVITVAGGSEINPGNDSWNKQTNITAAPDMTIGMSDNGPFHKNDVGDTYTLAVSNTGLARSSGTVSVTATLDSHLTATAISGSGWSCTLGTLTCTRSDALGQNGTYPSITVTVNVASNAPNPVTSSATVSGGGQVYTGNDTATDNTAVPSVATGHHGAAAVKSMSLRFSRQAHNRYAASGRLVTPAGVSRASACRGTVRLVISRAGKQLATHAGTVKFGCTFSIKGRLPKAARHQKVVVRATFLGNSLLKAKSTEVVR